MHKVAHRHINSWSARIGRVPTPLAGLALGIAGLGAAWASVAPAQAALFQLVSSLIAAVLVVKVILKFILHPHLIREELKHPVISSVMPTCAMATMVIAQSLHAWLPTPTRFLWLAAVVLHLSLLAAFIYHRLRDFSLDHMVPSWFIPPVGIVVAAVSSPGMGFENLAYFLFLFGLASYAVLLPTMLYRLYFRTPLPDAALPTFAIMGAPASLSLAGYVTITSQPDIMIIALLAPLSVFMTLTVYLAFIRLLRLPFSPGYAAFTFPMVIGATALLKLSASTNGVFADLFARLGYFELLVATVAVFYVAARYFLYYFPPRSCAA
ncbi:MAG: TDT family transporter [Kistimonas sp.]|nr:TDT family transporter [Kistimonas sp.]